MIANENTALVDFLSSIREFKLLDKVNLDEWPACVESDLICKTEEDKIERARGIIDLLMDFDFKDKSFLDFGCGEGYIVSIIKGMAKSAVGYDLVSESNDLWTKNDFLTTDLSKIRNETYDIILLYDVLDHCSDPLDVLKTVYSLLKEDGVVYVRCHPWCSRHGAHQYTTSSFNKAYIHLIFSPEELLKIGFKDESNLKITRPIGFYADLFNNSNFNVQKFNKEICIVEDYFLNNEEIKLRIMKSLGLTEWTQFQIEQVFLDYELKK